MNEPRWLDDDEMRLWRSFVAASIGVTSRLDALLKASSGLSFDDYEVLVHLSEADDQQMRMSELSDRLYHSRSRLSQRIDRMAGRDLVERRKCEADGRGTWAILTPTGLAAIASAAPHHVEHVRTNFLDHVSGEEVQILARSLERIAGYDGTSD